MLKLPYDEQSLWRSFYTETPYPRLDGEVKIDVAIVGGGISGLTTAYMLKQAGMSVAVIEKDTIGGGTSGRTTGKVTSQHNLFYDDLLRQLGKPIAKAYAEANQTAVEQVAAIVKKEKIACDWEEDDNFVYTTNPLMLETFKREAKAAASLGLPASFVTATDLPLDVRGAVKFTGQSKINTQKYLLGLAKAVDGDGSHVYEHSNAIGIRHNRVKTSAGKVVCKSVVVATNVPTLPLIARGAYCLAEYPNESYIVAGRLKRDFKGMYISPDKHNYSILPITVGKERWLLLGGEGHISGLRGNKQARYDRLADYAEEHFGLTDIAYHWSDRDYLSYDGPPLIGRIYPWSKELYVATAYRKWGLSNGTVAGMVLSDLIRGRNNPWAFAFDPLRLKPVTSIPRVAAHYLGFN